MKEYSILLFVSFLSCSNPTSVKIKKESHSILQYLKTEFRVKPDSNRFDSLWIAELKSEGRSTNLDSLILKNISVSYYAPLKLNFIHYENLYYYQDPKREDFYSIDLIEDIERGAFYLDNINENSGKIVEDYCLWSMLSKDIPYDDSTGISKEDTKAYNSIKTDRRYGEDEIGIKSRKTGIEQYLNMNYRFASIPENSLDSLIQAYDRNRWPFSIQDTLLSVSSLYGYLREQANEIRRQPNYLRDEGTLKYLKDQINLIILKATSNNKNVKFWIYKNGQRLRVRSLSKSGSLTSGIAYFLEEEKICF